MNHLSQHESLWARFESSVFINCPFDAAYAPMLRAIVFTSIACGFSPCCALSETDAAEVRIKKIQRMIAESRLGIHDISRTEVDLPSGLPRFNMPFELGLDVGAREYGNSRQRKKHILILDHTKYRYQSFLSDIAGQDIAIHDGAVDKLIKCVRDWLNNHRQFDAPPLAGGRHFIERHRQFIAKLPDLCLRAKMDMEDLVFDDFKFFVEEWISIHA